ncbi:MAG: hypothetical protein KDA92_21490, partial [Planctomycetales bacterium]|nr:hypothetical protein [Planctomycetales bacterium]
LAVAGENLDDPTEPVGANAKTAARVLDSEVTPGSAAATGYSTLTSDGAAGSINVHSSDLLGTGLDELSADEILAARAIESAGTDGSLTPGLTTGVANEETTLQGDDGSSATGDRTSLAWLWSWFRAYGGLKTTSNNTASVRDGDKTASL